MMNDYHAGLHWREGFELLHNIDLVVGIEGGDRFIGKQDRGLFHQATGELHSGLFTARELLVSVVQQVRNRQLFGKVTPAPSHTSTATHLTSSLLYHSES